VVNDTTYEELSTKWDALNFINSNSQAKEIDFELMKIRRFWTWFRPLMKWWFWIRAWFSLWCWTPLSTIFQLYRGGVWTWCLPPTLTMVILNLILTTFSDRYLSITTTQQTHDVTPTSGIRRPNVTSGKHVVTTLCSRNLTTLYHDVYTTLQNYVYTT
jgi:hypothetical protein